MQPRGPAEYQARIHDTVRLRPSETRTFGRDRLSLRPVAGIRRSFAAKGLEPIATDGLPGDRREHPLSDQPDVQAEIELFPRPICRQDRKLLPLTEGETSAIGQGKSVLTGSRDQYAARFGEAAVKRNDLHLRKRNNGSDLRSRLSPAREHGEYLRQIHGAKECILDGIFGRLRACLSAQERNQRRGIEHRSNHDASRTLARNSARRGGVVEEFHRPGWLCPGWFGEPAPALFAAPQYPPAAGYLPRLQRPGQRNRPAEAPLRPTQRQGSVPIHLRRPERPQRARPATHRSA